MKKLMRKSLATIAVAVILSIALIFSAFAGSFNHLANDLNDQGLFLGTGAGYELDREPTKAEALIMMIRLLGLEGEALAGEYEHPFADVPAWLSPYVAFAYEKGLMTGVSETTFGCNVPCTAQMYTALVLNALGYVEGTGDFTSTGAIEFGKSKGIIDDFLAEGTFTRNEMVAVSHLALAAAPYESEFGSLLKKLVASGAVEESAAAPVLKRFAVFEEFMAVGTELYEESSFAILLELEIDMGPFGAGNATLDMSMKIDETDVTAAINLDMAIAGEEISMQIFVVDGFVYMDMDGEKTKMDAGLADIEALLTITDMSAFSQNPTYLFKDVTKSTEGGYTVYTATLADSFMEIAMGIASEMMGGMGLDGLDLADLGYAIEVPALKYYADADGALHRMLMSMILTMDMEAMGIGMGEMAFGIDIDMEVVAVGDGVRIDLPDDLDEYELDESGALNPLDPGAAA